jgi:hypothetical protein
LPASGRRRVDWDAQFLDLVDTPHMVYGSGVKLLPRYVELGLGSKDSCTWVGKLDTTGTYQLYVEQERLPTQTQISTS